MKNQFSHNDKPDQAHNFVQVKKKLVLYFVEQCDDGGMMKTDIKEDTPFEATKPTAPLDAHGNEVTDKRTMAGCEFDMKCKAWQDKKDECDKNKPKVATTTFNQCTRSVQMKIEAKTEHKVLKNNPTLLLRAMQAITQNTDNEKYHTITALDALKRFINIQQLENEHLNTFMTRFKSAQDECESKFGQMDLNGCAERNPKHIKLKTELGQMTTLLRHLTIAGEMDATKAEAYDRFVAMVFSRGCSSEEAKELRKKCANAHNKGLDECPKNVEAAHKSVHHHKLENPPMKPVQPDKKSEGVAFTQTEWEQAVKGKDGKIHPKIK